MHTMTGTTKRDDISLHTNIRLVSADICPVVIYGAESLTLLGRPKSVKKRGRHRIRLIQEVASRMSRP